LELVDDAQFAWLCCKHVKSNAIVVAKVMSKLTFDLVFLRLPD
jgi:AICAR transformylase/IMP cyclohydrolase PurH